jgi:hypothetical protein
MSSHYRALWVKAFRKLTAQIIELHKQWKLFHVEGSFTCNSLISHNHHLYNEAKETCPIGRAIAQVVSRRLPTAAAWVQTWVGMWDFVMDKSGDGAGFLRELRFPLPIYIPSCSPQSSSLSPEVGTIRQEWPQCL